MTANIRPGTLWSRYRAAIVVAGLVASVALISTIHLRGGRPGGGGKGATELLQIGALPVT